MLIHISFQDHTNLFEVGIITLVLQVRKLIFKRLKILLNVDLWAWWGKEMMGQIKRVAWTYPLPYVTETASGELLFSTGGPPGCSVTT